MLGKENIVEIIIKRTLVLLVILLGIIFIFVKNPKPYAQGLVFGTLVGILTFLLMGKSVERAVSLSPDRAYAYTVRQYFLRMFIYGLVLVIGALADYLSFFTVALGLLMIKTVIIALTIIDSFKNKFK